MKILQVNKNLFRRDGASAHFLDVAELLVERGHEVELWGTRPPHPIPLPLRERISPHPIPLPLGERIKVRGDLLVEPLNFNKREGLVKDFKKFGHMLWSVEAAEKFEKVLKSFKPEVIHFHNIYHHLSPSILSVASRFKIPVVWTVHDYKWLCPNYKLFTQAKVCQRCRRYRYWNCLTHRCVQNSFLSSAAAAGEMYLHRWLQVYEKKVARVLAPSVFMRDLLINWGKDKNKIIHLPYFVKSPLGSLPLKKGELERDFILFAGRLEKEKGIFALLEIAKALPEIKFKIAGDIQHSTFNIQHLDNVEWLGFQTKEALDVLINQARLIAVPSLWYENYPFAVLEAQVQGKAVLASKIGGIPEMIEDGKTGFLVSLPSSRGANAASDAAIPLKHGIATLPTVARNDISEWVDKIKKIYYNNELLEKVGQAAKERVMRENDPEKFYNALMEIY